MTTQMTEEQLERLDELAESIDDLQDLVDIVYLEGYHLKTGKPKLSNKERLEIAIGRVYAMAGIMAVATDLSWTNICESAQRFEKKLDS